MPSKIKYKCSVCDKIIWGTTNYRNHFKKDHGDQYVEREFDYDCIKQSNTGVDIEYYINRYKEGMESKKSLLERGLNLNNYINKYGLCLKNGLQQGLIEIEFSPWIETIADKNIEVYRQLRVREFTEEDNLKMNLKTIKKRYEKKGIADQIEAAQQLKIINFARRKLLAETERMRKELEELRGFGDAGSEQAAEEPENETQ